MGYLVIFSEEYVVQLTSLSIWCFIILGGWASIITSNFGMNRRVIFFSWNLGWNWNWNKQKPIKHHQKAINKNHLTSQEAVVSASAPSSAPGIPQLLRANWAAAAPHTSSPMAAEAERSGWALVAAWPGREVAGALPTWRSPGKCPVIQGLRVVAVIPKDQSIRMIFVSGMEN